ncbi:hypothetical protein, partial [Escherichia coli]|uniref:hypothetical protein n=1 Tax=Escherichia coli TaxID=562 RepID=UPI0032DA60B2
MKQGKGFKPLRAKSPRKSGARPRTLPLVVVGVGALWFIPTPAHTRVSGVAALWEFSTPSHTRGDGV